MIKMDNVEYILNEDAVFSASLMYSDDQKGGLCSRLITVFR